MPARSVVFEVPEILETLERTTLVILDTTTHPTPRNDSGKLREKSRRPAAAKCICEVVRRLDLSHSTRHVANRRRRFSAEQKAFDVGLRRAGTDCPEFPSPRPRAVISSARLPDWQGIARFHDEKRRNETARRPS